MNFKDLLKDKLANVVVYGGVAIVVIGIGMFATNYMINRAKDSAKEVVKEAVITTVHEGKDLAVQAKNIVVEKTEVKVEAAKEHAAAARDVVKDRVEDVTDRARDAVDAAKERAAAAKEQAAGLFHKFQKTEQ